MLAFLWLLLLGSMAQAQGGPAVVINEIMWAGNEYVELFNTTDEPVSLAGWNLRRQKIDQAEPEIIVGFAPTDLIAPSGYFLLQQTGATDLASNGSLPSHKLVDDGLLLQLTDITGQVIDEINQRGPWYAGSKKNGVTRAMERISWSSPGTAASSWQTYNASDLLGSRFGTPGQVNSIPIISSPTPTPSPSTSLGVNPSPTPKASPTPSSNVVYSTAIVINRFLPNSSGSDTTDEFIELKNTGPSSVDLTSWQLDDAEGGSPPYRIPAGVTLAAVAVRSFMAAETKLALNNNGDSVRLFSPDGKIRSQFSYEKTTKGQVFPEHVSAAVASATSTVAATTNSISSLTPVKSPLATTRQSPIPTSGAVAGTFSRATPLAVINVAPSTSPAQLAIASPISSSPQPSPNLDKGGLYKVGGLVLAAVAVFGLTSYKSWLPLIWSS